MLKVPLEVAGEPPRRRERRSKPSRHAAQGIGCHAAPGSFLAACERLLLTVPLHRPQRNRRIVPDWFFASSIRPINTTKMIVI